MTPTIEKNTQTITEKKAALKKVPLNNPIYFCALGFGSGLIYPAPGTWGSLAGLIVGFLYLLVMPPLSLLPVVVIAFIIGCYLCDATAKQMGVHDHGSIVWDEFVGVWLVLAFVPSVSALWLIIAFLLFRVFDIIKPYPIAYFDRSLKGGVGIMVDDILAAVYAVIVMRLLALWLV